MKFLFKLLLAVVAVLVSNVSSDTFVQRSIARDLAYTSESTATAWKTCINTAGKKWCRTTYSTSSGYCWDSSDTSTFWGGGSITRLCTSDSTGFPHNSGLTLWPKDASVCGDQDQTLSKSSMSKTYTSNTISLGTVCWFEIGASESDITQITIKVDTLTSATMEVYYATSSSAAPRTLKSSQGVESKQYDIGTKAYLYVLVSPTASNAKVVFTATGNGSTSTSTSTSSSSSRRRRSGSNVGLIFAILVPGLCWIIVSFAVPIIVFRCCLKTQRLPEIDVTNLNNQGAVQVMDPSQSSPNGAYYEPSQYNATVQYINTDQSTLNNGKRLL